MKNRFRAEMLHILLLSICALTISPFIIAIISCFSTSSAIKGNDLLDNISLSNLITNANNLFQKEFFVTSLVNSLVVSFASAFLSTIFASLAGYAFIFINNLKYRNQLFLYTTSAMLVPTITIAVPIFMLFRIAGFLDTCISVVVVSMSLPLAILLFRQNAKLIPKELISIARIEGLNERRIFISIFLPNMIPTFLSAFVIAFINAWNSVLIPVILLQSQNKFTNAMFLNSVGSIWNADYGVLMLALMISSLPAISLFILLQKRFKKTVLELDLS